MPNANRFVLLVLNANRFVLLVLNANRSALLVFLNNLNNLNNFIYYYFTKTVLIFTHPKFKTITQIHNKTCVNYVINKFGSKI